MIINPLFSKAREHLKNTMMQYDTVEHISYFSFTDDIFVIANDLVYQIVGINSCFDDGQYIEIFISVDINGTLEHFDERAVKTFYFNSETIAAVEETNEEEIRKKYQRAEWRRFQKHVKKEKTNILSSEPPLP